MKRLSIFLITILLLYGFTVREASAQNAGELGIKIKSMSFEDISDSKAYLGVFGYINTAPSTAIGFEIGTVNIDSWTYVRGTLTYEESVDFTPIELNLKFTARSRGETGFSVDLGGGVSYNILSWELKENGVKIADDNENLIGWQVFVGGRYFFTPPRQNFGLFLGLEVKYQWVEDFRDIDLSNTRIGAQFGVLF